MQEKPKYPSYQDIVAKAQKEANEAKDSVQTENPLLSFIKQDKTQRKEKAFKKSAIIAPEPTQPAASANNPFLSRGIPQNQAPQPQIEATPSYSFQGQQIDRNTAMDIIGQAQGSEDLNGLNVSDDPEVMEGMQRKLNRLSGNTEQPLPVQDEVTEKQPVEDKPWWEDTMDGAAVGWDNLKGGMAYGAQQMADMAPSIAATAPTIGEIPGSPGQRKFENFGVEYRKELEKQESGESKAALPSLKAFADRQLEKARKRGEASDTDSWGYFIGNLIPQTVGIASAIGVGAVNPVAGMALGTANMAALSGMSMGLAANEYDQYVEQKGIPSNPNDKLATMLLSGAIESGSEAIPVAKFIPKGVKGQFAKTIFGSTEILAKQAKELFEEFLQQNKGLAPRVKDIAYSIGEGGLVEAPTEAIAELGQTFSTWLYKEKEDRETWEQIKQNTWHGFLGGFFMGGTLGPLSYAATQSQHNRRRSKAGKIVLAQNTETGETLEVAGIANPKKKPNEGGLQNTGEIIYEAVRPNGKTVEVSENQIGEIYEMPYDIFKNILKGKIKGEVAQETQVNQEIAQEAQAEIDEFKAQFEGVTFTDRMGTEFLSVGMVDGKEHFIVGKTTHAGIVVQPTEGGERKIVGKDRITDIKTISFEEFLAQAGPVPQDAIAPFDPSNPIQKGEIVTITGPEIEALGLESGNWVVTGVNIEEGTVLIEGEEGSPNEARFETIPLDIFQQFRKPTDENINPQVENQEKTGGEKLRDIFMPGDQVDLSVDQQTPVTDGQQESGVEGTGSEVQVNIDADLPTQKDEINNAKINGNERSEDARYIPFEIVEKAWENDNQSQSAKDIVNRGGYSFQEMDILYPDWRIEVKKINQQQDENDEIQQDQESGQESGQEAKKQDKQATINEEGQGDEEGRADEEQKVRTKENKKVNRQIQKEHKAKLSKARNAQRLTALTMARGWILDGNQLRSKQDIQNAIKSNQVNKGVREQTGMRGREMQELIGIINNKTGLSIEDAAHSIWESIDPQLMESITTMDLRDAIISILLDEPRSEWIDNQINEAIGDSELTMEQEEQKMIDALSPEEYADYQEFNNANNFLSENQEQIEADLNEYRNSEAYQNYKEENGITTENAQDGLNERDNDGQEQDPGQPVDKGAAIEKDGGLLQEDQEQGSPKQDSKPTSSQEQPGGSSSDSNAEAKPGTSRAKGTDGDFTKLNPKGKFIQALQSAAESGLSGGQMEALKQKGQTLSILRKKFPQLTDLHENEIFDALNEKNAKPDQIAKKIADTVPRFDFDPSEKIGLIKEIEEGPTNKRTEIDKQIDRVTKRLREIAKLPKTNTLAQTEKKELTKELNRLQITRQKTLTKGEAGKPAEQGDAFDQKPKEDLSKTLNKKEQELKDLFNDFFDAGKGNLTSGGITPEQFSIAGKIIAKAGEVGIVRFKQLIEWVRKNIGEAKLRDNFDAFKAAYVANLSLNNPMDESLDEVSKLQLNDLLEESKNDTGKEGSSSDIEVIESKVKAIEAKAKTTKSRKQSGKDLEEVDSLISDIDNQLVLLGEYVAPESQSNATEYPHKAHEKYFKKDLVKFSKELAKELGWEHETDKRGKKIYANTNVAPAGGDGMIILWKPDSEYGVYISVPVDNQGYVDDKEGLKIQSAMGPSGWMSGRGDGAILWRITEKKNKYTGFGNQFVDSKTTVGDFKKLIQKEIQKYVTDENQGQRSDGPPSPETKKRVGGTQAGSGEQTKGTENVQPVSSGKTGESQSDDRQPERKGVQLPGSGGTNQPVSDGGPGRSGESGNTGTKTDRKAGGRTKSDLEKRVQKTNKNKENFSIPKNFTYPDTFRKAERFDQNIEALELLVQMVSDGRTEATAEEKKTLFGYSGFGGITEIAKPSYASFDSQAMKDRVNKVQGLLKKIDPDGSLGVFESIKQSINSAHYTEPEIIRSHFDVLEQMGFLKGKILDPSAGIGNYFGSMPEKMMIDSNLNAVELDFITSEIFKRLYPGSKIQNSGLQDAKITENTFDLVISNIPFGSSRVYDPLWKGKKQPVYRSAQARIHNYFVLKMIESAKEGGFISILTSSAVLDTPGNKSVRQFMADNTNFIGAVRLPNSAFKGSSGTKVVTDIIFLQKRKAGEVFEQKNDFVGSVQQVTDGSTYYINQYFLDNPGHVLGEIKGEGGQYDREKGYTVEGEADGLRARVVKAMQKAAKTIDYSPASGMEAVKEKVFESYEGERAIRSGNIFYKDGKFFEAVSKTSDDKWSGEEINVFKKYEEPTKDYIGIRNTLNELIDKERAGMGDSVLTPLRESLKEKYDNFVDKHGRLNEYKNNFNVDIDFYQVLSLENIDKDGEFSGLAAIFTKRTINPNVRPSAADSPQEAILISMNEFNAINPVRMVELLGEDWVEQSGDLVFQLPNGKYESRDEYLSGDIYKKIEEVEGNPKFEKNLNELKKVLPEPLPISLITVPLGARYVDTDVYSEFLQEELGFGGYRKGYIKISYIEGLDSFKLNNRTNSNDYQTSRVDTREIVEKAFSDQTISVWNVSKNSDGSTTRTYNEAASLEANTLVSKLRNAWKTWLPQKQDYAQVIADTYNRLFNSTVKRKFDGSHMSFPGLRGIELRQHQKDAINMIVQNNGGVIDHIVGAGKTFIMVSGAIELKRLGVAKKPLIIAKKSTVTQIAESFRLAYPAAKILSPTESDFSAKNRKKLLSRISLNDWDAVILTHENFTGIEPDPETAKQVIQDEIDLMVLSVEDLRGGDKSQMTNRQIKGLETRIDNLKAKIKELSDTKRDKEIADFGKLGIDHIMVDESQSFKNLNYSTVHSNVAGLGSPAGVKKTFNLLMGIRYLQKIHKGDKGTTFLSGTPISNTMAELYLILKYLRPDRLQELGISTFDSWAKTFAEKSSELEFGVSGSLKAKERFRRFINIPELAKLYTDIADIRNDSNIKLPKPKVKGGTENFNLITPGRNLEQFYKKLIHYATTGDGSVLDIPGFDWNSEEAKKAKMLKVTDLATKASIDLRLIYPQAPFDPSSKLATVAKDVSEKYDETKKHKGVSLVFMDSGKTSQYNPKFNGERALRDMLVNEYGVKAGEIELMANHKSDKKKEKLFQKVNNGEVRILIGSTETMGTGVNVQERVVSMHHVDIPWRPSDYEQRNGRGLRQGNLVAAEHYDNEVEVAVYGVERSLDAYKFELLSIKQAFIDQIKNGSTADRIADEGSGDEESGASFADFMAAATGNPIIKEKAKNDKLIDQLQVSKQAYFNRIGRAKQKIDYDTRQINNLQSVIDQLKKYKDIAEKSGISPENYPIEIGGKTFEKPTDGGKALLNAKPYSEEQINIMKRGGDRLTPHASVLGWDLFVFKKPIFGGKGGPDFNAAYLISVKDSSGRLLFPKSDYLSDSPPHALNTIKTFINGIGGVINNNEDLIPEHQESIVQSKKILEEKWEDQKKYDAAIEDQKRIAVEVDQMNKDAQEKNAADEDIQKPMFSDPEPDVKFKKSPPQPKTTPKQRKVQRMANEVVSGWKDKPEVIAFNNQQEVKDYFNDESLNRQDLSNVEAMVYTDPETGKVTVAILADNATNQTPESLKMNIVHEVVGHYGVRKFILDKLGTKDKAAFNKAFNEILDGIIADRWSDPMIESLSRDYFGKPFHELNLEQMREMAEEYIAHRSETEKGGLWDQLVSFVREWMRKAGIKLKYSDNEIRNLIANGYKVVKGGILDGQSKPGVFMANEPMSLAKMTEEQMRLEIIDGFYSPIEKRIREFKQPKASATKWKEIVGKKDEAQWTGVFQYLDGLKPDQQVTKEELVDWMKDNRVKIEVVEKGSIPEKSFLSETEARELFNEGEDVFGIDDQGVEGLIENESDFDSFQRFVIESSIQKGNPTKFSEYQLPGEKSDYKEVLVTLPNLNKLELPKGYKVIPKSEYSQATSFTKDFVVVDEEGLSITSDNNKNTAIQTFLKTHSPVSEQYKQYKSDHFDEPNILVHLRMNTRTDAEGNKVLFLEEVQSDWGQKGKKQGFDKSLQNEPEITIERVSKGENAYTVFFSNGQQNRVGRGVIGDNASDSEVKNYFSGILGEMNLEVKRLNSEKIPNAPFVTDTNSWIKLGLKIAMQEAVKTGANKIAWTTGEQQNDRYDLSKQVDFIEYDDLSNAPVYAKTGEKTWMINASKKGKEVFRNTATVKELPDLVGKEIAEKIVNSGKKSDKLSGLDLQVGGTGMKSFYGSPESGDIGMVGRVMESLVGKKTVQPTTIEGNQQPSIDVTPQVSDQVTKGLPLFKKGLPQETVWKQFTVRENGNMYTNVDIPSKGLYAVPVEINKFGEYREITEDLYNAAKIYSIQNEAIPYDGQENALERRINQAKEKYHSELKKDKALSNFSGGTKRRGRATGNIRETAWMTRFKKSTNPDIRFKVSPTNKELKDRAEGTLKEDVSNWENFLTKFVDYMTPAKRMVQSVLGDRELSDAQDFITKENLGKGKTKELTEQFLRNIYNPIIETSKAINKEYGINTEGISDYLQARHHAERKERITNQYIEDGKKIPKDEKWPTGFTDEEAATIVSDFESTVSQEDATKLRDLVQQASQFVNDRRFETGMISEKVYRELTAMYADYVPLRGYEELIGEDTTMFSPLIAAKGRTSKAASPLPYLLTAAQEAILRGESNLVRQSVLEFVKEFPSQGNYNIRNGWYVKTDEKDSEGNDIWKEQLERPTKDQINSGDAVKSVDPMIQKTVNLFGAKDQTLPLYIKGKRVFIDFKDPRIALAVKNKSQDELSWFMQKLNKFTRWLSGMHTQYSPEFGPVNLLRDMGFGTFNILLEKDGKLAKDTIKTLNKSRATLWKYFWTDKHDLTTEDGRLLKEWLDEGGLTGFNQSKEAKEIFEDAQKEIDQMGTRLGDVKDFLKNNKTVHFVEAYNKTLENVMRFSYYKALKDRGYSNQQAAIESKDLTVNFNRKGNSTTFIGAMFMFFNAAVQGNERLLRNFGNKKTLNRMLTGVGTVIAAGMTQGVLNGLFGGDDDDDEKLYSKISEYTRRTNIILPMPGTGNYFRIPLPYGVNVFYSMGESLGAVMTGMKEPGSEAMGVLTTISDSFSPIGGFDFEGDAPFWEKALTFILPSTLRPPAEYAFNRNFMGNPIRKEPFTPNQYKRPESQMHFPGVNPVVKGATDALNKVTGGNEIEPGLIDINPEMIEHGIDSYLGGPARFGGNVTSTVGSIFSGENVFSDPYYRKLPFVRKFVTRAGTQYDAQQSFYENFREIETTRQKVEIYRKEKTPQEYGEVMRENRKTLSLADYAKSTKKEIDSFNDQIDQLKKADSKAANERIEKLYEARTKIMKGFNRIYNSRKD